MNTTWIPESTARELDRPATRDELARRATAAAREAAPGIDIEILWDGMWIRRVGPNYFPDPDMWRTPEPNWSRWTGAAEKYLRDAEDYWFHVYRPQAGDVIVDIGAGRGEDVFAFSKAVGDAGRVWAIEPHPISFSVLKNLCELNHLANVVPLNYACVDAPAQLQIETLPVWESNYVRNGAPTPTSHSVEGIRFDDLAAEMKIGDIDFLKMNIEGAERTALPGCRDALKRTRFTCIAAHDFRAARGEGEHFRTLDVRPPLSRRRRLLHRHPRRRPALLRPVSRPRTSLTWSRRQAGLAHHPQRRCMNDRFLDMPGRRAAAYWFLAEAPFGSPLPPALVVRPRGVPGTRTALSDSGFRISSLDRFVPEVPPHLSEDRVRPAAV